MSSRLRRVAKYTAVTVGVGAVGVAAVTLPPKEALPTALLPSRVLLDGIGRAGRCVWVGGEILAQYTFHVRADDPQEVWNETHRCCAKRLVSLAETNGGLYVKAGQIFANMTHILPYQYCHEMAVLQDAVVKRPYSEIVAVLEKDLQAPIDTVFSYVDPVPIAAASLAQVHKGKLRRENVEVAIKVQYIDMAHRFRGDMRTIDLMLSIAGYIFPGFDFGEIINKLNDTVAAELDFRLEAGNSDRAAADLKRGGFGNRVVCAKIYWEYVTKRVLLSEFVQDGVKITDKAGLQARGIDVAQVATWLFDALAYQHFITGFFHGDPHAGNVLVHKLPNGKPQVVLLDYGLCAELDDAQRREISDIWTSCITHDTPTLKRISEKYNCADHELFASCFLQHPYTYYSAEGGRVMAKDVQQSIRDLVKTRMTEVNDIVASLPKEYALILRGIMASKAINRELGDVVNRPMRMLYYSLKTSHEDESWLRMRVMITKAWVVEKYSALMLRLAKWRHPELTEMFETELQISG